MKLLEQELKDIWKYSSQEEKNKFDTSRMLIELKSKLKQIDKRIYKKDQTEIITSVFGILLFQYFFQKIPFLFSKIACMLGVLWFVLVIMKFINTKKTKSPKDLDFCLLEQLEYQKRHYQFQQARLFETSAYWYALPPFLMNLIFIIVIGEPIDYGWPYFSVHTSLFLSNMKLTSLISLAMFFGLNTSVVKHSIKKTIQLLITDIERVLFRLENQ